MENCQHRRKLKPRSCYGYTGLGETKNLTADEHGFGRGDILRAMNQRQQSGMARAGALLILLAVAIFLAGAARYYRHGSFTLAQAGYCLVAILASLVVLLIFDYTLHHAKI